MGFLILFLCVYLDAYTNFILLGSNGDLARRYIWDGLFQIANREEVYIHGVGRSDPAIIEGNVREKDILSCQVEDGCERRKENLEGHQIVKLKKDEEYQRFDEELNE
eukprot:TRINITY_DN4504_c0_g1_i1.p1 TRINITY_DN4504_c0_g1~~TRINITY_DN4504_c0_g1_i1.p1  ORF type:complete len:107 (-),score=13.57 TRINITY_DN4504_c0_g1_i1:87-407(-)